MAFLQDANNGENALESFLTILSIHSIHGHSSHRHPWLLVTYRPSMDIKNEKFKETSIVGRDKVLSFPATHARNATAYAGLQKNKK